MRGRDQEFAEFFSARFDGARRIAYASWAKIRIETVDAYGQRQLEAQAQLAELAERLVTNLA